MSPSNKTLPFLWLTRFFILSMLLVVCCSDLFFTMLGWDGLGLISFFLIVFYQNQRRITSGLFTLFINRLGDSFFIVSIVLLFLNYPSSDLFSFHIVDSILVVFLVLAFCTKRAVFPFSSWLPAAIAAPTPISALVHSSTLVASGLFLMMRYSYLIYQVSWLVSTLLIFTIFTSFYAGINSLFEVDIKKLIALSTLSHLGFIGLAFSRGLLRLAFFHILVHALFKSLLFMCMGDIIHCSGHSQDIRHLGSGFTTTPFSSQVMQLCLANLLGLPMLSGFFSKDLVLEMLAYSNLSYLLTFMVYLSVFFTYFYTFKIFLYSVKTSGVLPLILVHPSSSLHWGLLCVLGLFTIFSGRFFISVLFKRMLFVVVPFYVKIAPVVINFILFWFIFINKGMFLFLDKYLVSYFSSIMFLTKFVSSLSSFVFYSVSCESRKTCEDGFYYSLLNSYFYSISYFVSSKFLFVSSKFLFVSFLFVSFLFVSFYLF